MLSIGPYSAWIVVDGVGLETYCYVSSCSGHTATAGGYIPSEAGKSFSLLWHNYARDVPLEAVITIDGVECNRHVMLPARDFPDKPDTVRVSYARTSEFTRRDFVFSSIEVIDDDDHLSTVDYTKFGVITLDLWRLKINRVVRRPLQIDYKSPILESQILHERTKRGGTHHVKFGEEYNVPLPTVDMVDGQKMDGLPIASFIFRYKPRDILLAQGIIPRPLQIACHDPTVPRRTGPYDRGSNRDRDLEQLRNHTADQVKIEPSS